MPNITIRVIGVILFYFKIFHYFSTIAYQMLTSLSFK